MHTCVPFDPESKGWSEATVRIAKADLVPTKANLLSGYNSFAAALAEACEGFCVKVNGRPHRETARVPAEALVVEQQRMHPFPDALFTAALGETRSVGSDQTIRYGSVRYSTPPGLIGHEVWTRVDGEGWSSPPRWKQGWSRSPGIGCPHRATPASTCPTTPTIPKTPTGPPAAATQGPQPGRSRVPGAGSGCPRVAGRGRRSRRPAGPVEDDRRTLLAALVGTEAVDAALGVAATAGRFAEGDLLAIVEHRANGASIALVIADEDHSAQPGTSAWAAFGTPTPTDQAPAEEGEPF